MEENNVIKIKNYQPVARNMFFFNKKTRQPETCKLHDTALTYRHLMHTTRKEGYQKQRFKINRHTEKN